MIANLLHLRLVFWPRWLSILMNVPCELEGKNVYSCFGMKWSIGIHYTQLIASVEFKHVEGEKEEKVRGNREGRRQEGTPKEGSPHGSGLECQVEDPSQQIQTLKFLWKSRITLYKQKCVY